MIKLNELKKLFEIIKSGGLAIIPSKVGYTLIGNSEQSIKKMFLLKERPLTKPCVVLTNKKLISSLAKTVDYDLINSIDKQKLLCGFILKIKQHPLFNSLSKWTFEHSQKNGTSCFVMNAGEYFDELVNMATKEGILLVGSSANKSGTGNEGIFRNLPQNILLGVDAKLEDDEYINRTYDSKTRKQGVMIHWIDGKAKILREGAFYEEIVNILNNHKILSGVKNSVRK